MGGVNETYSQCSPVTLLYCTEYRQNSIRDFINIAKIYHLLSKRTAKYALFWHGGVNNTPQTHTFIVLDIG